MVGERVVCGRGFGRTDFDVFLGVLVVVEVGLVGWFFGGLGRVGAEVWWGVDLMEFVVLVAVGWVASWGPFEQGEGVTMMV